MLGLAESNGVRDVWRRTAQAGRGTWQKAATFVSKPVVVAGASAGAKQVSAMMRVRNEEEYLLAAVLSIIDVVEEVVLIDNGSTDATPDIIAALVREHPRKVRSVVYPHAVARYGDENRALAATRRGRRSPSLLANFYNWSMAQCRHDYILKWDGDTIALPSFREDVIAFKQPAASRGASKQALWYVGANLHPNLQQLIQGHPYEVLEPRLVTRRFAKYTNYLGYCEGLESPYIGRFRQFSQVLDRPAYLHMKFCKRNRYTNMSADLAAFFANGVDDAGEFVPDELADVIRELDLAAQLASES